MEGRNFIKGHGSGNAGAETTRFDVQESLPFVRAKARAADSIGAASRTGPTSPGKVAVRRHWLHVFATEKLSPIAPTPNAGWRRRPPSASSGGSRAC